MMDLLKHRTSCSFVVLPAPALGRVALALCAAAMLSITSRPLLAADNGPAGPEKQIRRLVPKLGAAQYEVRERAQEELRRYGLLAFDALLDAQHHEDVEIAFRARYLIRSMQVRWTRPSDPPQVKEALRGYERLRTPDQRTTRIERLAGLENGLGAEALCRISRFDRSQVLSKKAALAIIGQPQPAEAGERAALAQQIQKAVGESRRAGASWLRAYSQSLLGAEASVAAWTEIIKDEEEVFGMYPERSSRQIVLSLHRWRADLLRNLGRRDDALQAMLRMIEFQGGRRIELIETVEWLIERKAWSAIDELARRFPQRFEGDGELLYRQAEAQLRQDQRENAERLAKQAFEIDEKKDARHHDEVATRLQSRGLFDWSQRHFRHVIASGPEAGQMYLDAHVRLSEMLHDIGRHKTAAEVLGSLVKAAETNEDVKKLVEQSEAMPSITSRMNYFRARHLAESGKKAERIAQLEKALEANPLAIDALIHLYNTEGLTKEQRQRYVELVNQATDNFRNGIRAAESRLMQERDAVQRQNLMAILAGYCNQMAWLVGNTEGDLDEAVRLSHRSLELRPNTAAYYDTLAHCYFAKKDYAKAVAYQKEAHRLEPHSGQIGTALRKFQQALAQSKQSDASNPDRNTAGNPADVRR